eukprot:CAMPEP_0178370934 /NCGR_PEP_ID=MMETSP0689_2-20121128/562_1 /TAXON_ID=160604 /ORGANISM="Amphidinium massartii, Strain CS-259" /LENGTH=352 /DNA_ID=CAMNT_0019990779 /DNA_START=124 /DNA_END=1182 /DNA_ORIENTATION=-
MVSHHRQDQRHVMPGNIHASSLASVLQAGAWPMTKLDLDVATMTMCLFRANMMPLLQRQLLFQLQSQQQQAFTVLLLTRFLLDMKHTTTTLGIPMEHLLRWCATPAIALLGPLLPPLIVSLSLPLGCDRPLIPASFCSVLPLLFSGFQPLSPLLRLQPDASSLSHDVPCAEMTKLAFLPKLTTGFFPIVETWGAQAIVMWSAPSDQAGSLATPPRCSSSSASNSSLSPSSSPLSAASSESELSYSTSPSPTPMSCATGSKAGPPSPADAPAAAAEEDANAPEQQVEEEEEEVAVAADATSASRPAEIWQDEVVAPATAQTVKTGAEAEATPALQHPGPCEDEELEVAAAAKR